MNYDHHIPFKPNIFIFQDVGEAHKTVLQIETFCADTISIKFINLNELITFRDRLDRMVTAIQHDKDNWTGGR